MQSALKTLNGYMPPFARILGAWRAISGHNDDCGNSCCAEVAMST